MMSSTCSQSPFKSIGRPNVNLSKLEKDLGVHLPPPNNNSNKITVPIVYSPLYNIRFFGIEKLHPFDSTKFEKIVSQLSTGPHPLFSPDQLIPAPEIPPTILQQVHTPSYLNSLKHSSLKVAQVTELAPLALMPCFLLERKVLRPMRHMVGGTVAASLLALHHGWSINLGGGMHHAHYEDGGGWCVYSDIGSSQWYLRNMMMKGEGGGGGGGGEGTATTTTTTTAATNFLIIDCDVHQGNGLERDKLRMNDTSTIIVDVYNKDIYPGDVQARKGITIERRIGSGTGDADYLNALQSALDEVAAGISNGMCAKPDLLYYNAGTDILVGDPLGSLNVSEQGVVKRDEMVFQLAVDVQCPIVMLLSGGYTKKSAPTVVNSIRNLYDVFQLHRDLM